MQAMDETDPFVSGSAGSDNGSVISSSDEADDLVYIMRKQ